MEENKKDVLPLEGEPLTTPQISEPVVNALAAALSKIETYVPTQYIDDGPPDIDADHLNHAEQAIMRVTNLANGAADAISALQSQVTQLNSDLGYYITSEDDFSHTLIGGAAQNITLNSKITLEQYTRILFLNYPGSNDGALLAIAPGDKIITAFRNNGVWEEKSSQFIATKSDLGDLITHRKTTGNTSDSGNITINRPEGYSLIGAYINSIYVRLSIPTVYQKTIIVRCFDENMSPLKNTLVEVISLWIKKDISY